MKVIAINMLQTDNFHETLQMKTFLIHKVKKLKMNVIPKWVDFQIVRWTRNRIMS